jgi:hypothetical protein
MAKTGSYSPQQWIIYLIKDLLGLREMETC